MSKMSTESARIALNGPTMGTRWSALFFAEPDFDPAPILAALQAAVEEVDGQMSTWNAGSDLMRLNAAPVGEWVAVPAQLAAVLRLGLEIGRASGGAFDIGMGDAVTAWGFGPDKATSEAIRAAMEACRQPAHEVLEIDGARVRKSTPIALDLNGIAKGYGVDRLAETLRDYGITDALVGIDGEMRAMGLRPDGAAWAIAVEAPGGRGDGEDRRGASSPDVTRGPEPATKPAGMDRPRERLSSPFAGPRMRCCPAVVGARKSLPSWPAAPASRSAPRSSSVPSS